MKPIRQAIRENFSHADPAEREYSFVCNGRTQTGARCKNRAVGQASNGLYYCHLRSHRSAVEADGAACVHGIVCADTGEIVEEPVASTKIQTEEVKTMEAIEITTKVVETKSAARGGAPSPVDLSQEGLKELAAKAYAANTLLTVAYYLPKREFEKRNKKGRVKTLSYPAQELLVNVRPLDVFSFTNSEGTVHTYLKGYDMSDKKLKSYRLDRITAIGVSDMKREPKTFTKVTLDGEARDAVVNNGKVLIFPNVDAKDCRVRFKGPQTVSAEAAGKYLASGQWALTPNLHVEG